MGVRVGPRKILLAAVGAATIVIAATTATSCDDPVGNLISPPGDARILLDAPVGNLIPPPDGGST